MEMISILTACFVGVAVNTVGRHIGRIFSLNTTGVSSFMSAMSFLIRFLSYRSCF